MAGRRLVTRRRLGPAAMVLLPFSPQDAVEAGFRGEIAALVCEAGHNLAGRQALEGLAVAGVQHGLAFRLRQLVARCRSRCRRAAILRSAVPGSPTTIGALVNPEFKTQLANLDGTVLGGSPADFGKLIAEETEKWRKVIRLANIKPE